MRTTRFVNIRKAFFVRMHQYKKQLFNAIEFKARVLACCPLIDTTAEDAIFYDAHNPTSLRSHSKHEVSISTSREDYWKYGEFLRMVVGNAYPNVDLHLQEGVDTTRAVASWTGPLIRSGEV